MRVHRREVNVSKPSLLKRTPIGAQLSRTLGGTPKKESDCLRAEKVAPPELLVDGRFDAVHLRQIIDSVVRSVSVFLCSIRVITEVNARMPLPESNTVRKDKPSFA
jgi:hypothetical protein